MTLLTANQVATALAPRVSATFDDPQYVLIGRTWLVDEFLPWWRHHLDALGMDWVPGLRDCEDFAREFIAQLIVATRRERVPAGLAAAVLSVRNLSESLGIRTGLHALVLAGVTTTSGPEWLVIEPQNNRHETLDSFHTADRLRAAF